MAQSPEDSIERGEQIGAQIQPTRIYNWLVSWAQLWTSSASPQDPRKADRRQIEDFPQGYPRFSALIASHSSFHVCRRFSNLRVRLLLLKQDRLSLLEKRLESIDQKDSASLSLACCRRDENSERQDVLAELDDAFADYDKCIERCQRALDFEAAPYRTVSNLRNWVRGNGCIARNEIAYLEHTDDLLSLTTSEDRLVTWLTDMTEDVHVFFRGLVSSTKATSALDTGLGISRDPNVHIFPSSLLGVTVYTFVVPLITILLLTPVIICNFVNDLSARLVVVVLATMGFTIALSGLTKTRTVELIIAGATYTTVLVVFISGTGGTA